MAIVQADGEITSKSLAMFDQPREPVELKDDFEVLGEAVYGNVQCRTVCRIVGHNPALTAHHAPLMSYGKFDGDRTLVEMVKAIAWHER